MIIITQTRLQHMIDTILGKKNEKKATFTGLTLADIELIGLMLRNIKAKKKIKVVKGNTVL